MFAKDKWSSRVSVCSWGYFQDHRVEQQHLSRKYLAPKIRSPVAKKWPRGSQTTESYSTANINVTKFDILPSNLRYNVNVVEFDFTLTIS